jgi:peptidoglycan/LPS O-acetylase OafA/YrhL
MAESVNAGAGGLIAGGHRPDLQGMRAIAVLTVFSNHLFDWPSGGFVGVDIFFVLSGFFITLLLIRERTTEHKLSFQNFYTRRIKRILPSALLVLTVTVLGAYLLFPTTRAKNTLTDALYAAVFGANFRFQAIEADYFQRGQPPSPVQHYWSLSIEEQFYFVWPAMLALLFTLTRRHRRGGKNWIHQWGLFSVMSGIVIVSFGWALYLSAHDPNGAYFSTLTRIWELGVGAMLAIAGPWLVRIPSSIRLAVAYLGLTGVVASLFLIDSTVQFPAPWAALPVLSTALVVASFHGVAVRGIPLLTNPVARYLGDTSYTLYLWHWPVIVLLLAIIPKGVLFYSLALILSLGLTAVTYRFYENPIRKSRWLIGTAVSRDSRFPTLSPRIWGLAGVVMVVAVVMSILGLSLNEKQAAATAYKSKVPESAAEVGTGVDACFGAPAIVTPGCKLWNPGEPLYPSLESFAYDMKNQIDKNGCFGYEDSGEKLPSCSYGYGGPGAIRIALVGDSHAAQLLPAFWPVLLENKWNLTSYLGFECTLANPTSPRCERRMSDVEAELTEKPYELVIITNLNRSEPPSSYQKAWVPIAARSRIAVVADSPRTSEEAIACLSRVKLFSDRTGDCGTPRATAFPTVDPLVTATQLVPGATLIDLTQYYCTSEFCPSVIGNAIVYRDYVDGNSHLTATYAETLAGPLQNEIRKALDSRP